MRLTSDIRLITTSFSRSWISRTSRVFSPVVRRRTRTYREFLIGCISLKIKIKTINKSKYYISIFSLIFSMREHLLSQWHISLLFPTVEIKKRSRFHTLMKIDIFTCYFLPNDMKISKSCKIKLFNAYLSYQICALQTFCLNK